MTIAFVRLTEPAEKEEGDTARELRFVRVRGRDVGPRGNDEGVREPECAVTKESTLTIKLKQFES